MRIFILTITYFLSNYLHAGLLEAQVVVFLLLPDPARHFSVDLLHFRLPAQGRLFLDGLAPHFFLPLKQPQLVLQALFVELLLGPHFLELPVPLHFVRLFRQAVDDSMAPKTKQPKHIAEGSSSSSIDP